MKAIFHGILILMAAGASASAQQPRDLTGNWKEQRRMDAKGDRIVFSDTFRVEFLIGNEYLWRQKGSFSFKGVYKVIGNKLDMGSRYFTIVRSDARQLVLQDENYTYELGNYTPAQVQEDNSRASSGARGDRTPEGAVSVALMSGTWETYKRTSNAQLQQIDYRRLIRKIGISETNGRISGTVTPAQYARQAQAWTITRYEKGILYCQGPDARQLEVKKCSDGELVVAEGAITYFFKRAP